MQSFGGFLVFIGLGSFVLRYLDMEFIVLSWVDNWGAGTGNGIRIACVVVGAILWFLGKQQAAKSETPPA